MLQFFIEVQRTIREMVSADIAAFSDTGNWFTLMSVLPLGVAFGVAHAMTPGHSKSVLAAYVLGSGQGPGRAFATSAVLALMHISSAVVLALVANTLVTRTLVGAGQAPALEFVSRLMLVAIGAWLIIRAFRNRPHLHGEGTAFGAAAGLIPCPLTLFTMTFAASRGVPEAGFAFALAMLIGVGSVLALVALATALARKSLARHIASHGTAIGYWTRGLDLAAGVLLMVVALSSSADKATINVAETGSTLRTSQEPVTR